MKLLLSTLLLVACSLTATAQKQKNVPFDKKAFPRDQKKEVKEAIKQIEEGDDWFSGSNNKYGLPQPKKALTFYLKAQEFNPNNDKLNLKIGLCYLKSLNKSKSLSYLEKAYEINPLVDPDIEYHIGRAHQYNYNWKKAIKSFENWRKTLSPADDIEKMRVADKALKECRTGERLMNDPERVWIDNLGEMINTEYPEYSPYISADEGIIIFTSRRPDTRGGGIDEQDNKYFEDIYISEKNKETGKWEKAVNMGSKINRKTHDAPAGVSPDGQKLFVYYGDKGTGDIYESNLEEGEWQKPEELGKNINTKDYRESGAALSFDGKYLYFISGKPGGLGERDIYRSKWDEEEEEWGEATNLGPTINTPYDEVGVFFHPDGKTMFYASEGHESMGGYDIFYSVMDENGVWGKPVNIGYPINTPDDDVFFVLSASGRHGYYSSFSEKGFGEMDLYRITFLGPEKEPQLSGEDNLIASLENPVKQVLTEPTVEVKESNVAILTGIVRDAKTMDALKSSIELIDNEENTVIAEFSSDGKTGKYLVSLPAGKNYGIAVKADGYLFHSENFDIPKASGYKQYNLDIDMKKVEVGQSIVLKNIFFDYNKYSLRSASKNELERLTKLMEDNPSLVIEISGHTDTRGNDNYNQKLSENRARSVVNYLIENGVSKDRLVYKGYGEEQTLISDAEIAKMKNAQSREDAHQMNRRTEFKILKM